jgi:predicted RNase H-like HicB family nuclease
MKNSKLDYIIKLTFDKDYQGYVAEVVNLYGCMSQGKTKEEALDNVEKAIKAFTQALNIKGGKNSEFRRKTVDLSLPLVNA